MKQNAINKQINEDQVNMTRKEGELKEVNVERERVTSIEVGNELDLNAKMCVVPSYLFPLSSLCRGVFRWLNSRL